MNKREKLNFQLIELELSYYHQTKKELEDYRSEVVELSGRRMDRVAEGGHVYRPTESRALTLITSIAIKEMERRVAAIDYVLDLLKQSSEPRKLKLIELKYFRNSYSDLAIQRELHIEQATFYRWKKEVIQLIAMRLGMEISK
jgi:RinA family phage transcriptional activator